MQRSTISKNVDNENLMRRPPIGKRPKKIRAGTNTPSDEYDSYREYRVANTNKYSRIGPTVIRCIHSRILLTECASEEEVLFGKYMWVTLYILRQM